MLLLTALYAAQGIPFGFFTLALPAVMRQSGQSLTVIGFTGLLALPWFLKFLWAPYLDYLRTPRSWLLNLQFAGVACALVLACIDIRSNWPLAIGAMVFNTVAASQDVVTDGLAVRMLTLQDRSIGNGIQVGAYRIGMILGGAVLVMVFAKTNWSVMFLCMAALLMLTVLPVMSLSNAATPKSSLQPTAKELALQWLRRLLTPGVASLIALIICYRLGDAMISRILIPFLVDKGLSFPELAAVKGALGSSASLAGAFLGAWVAFRVRRRTLLLVAGLAQAVSFTPYLLVANDIGGRELLWVATAGEGLIGTVATVALFTLMMDGSDPEHAGTDYTLYASAVVGIDIAGGLLGGVLGDAFGYGVMFTIAIGLCVLGSLVLVWRLDRHPASPRVAQAWGRLSTPA